jgi:hypothetical protein
MGYAHYTITRDGKEIEAGYGVDAACETPDCTAEIDRGLAYLCGETPGGDERGCGGYHCDEHMLMASDGDWTGQLCGPCAEKLDDDEEQED